MKDASTIFTMTQSFRVDSNIASKIQTFCQSYFDPSMKFLGTDITDPTISTRAIITRTNAALVGYMIDLEESGTPYSLVRKAADIYKLPLLVTTLKKGCVVTDPLYRHLTEDIAYYFDYIQPEDILLRRKSTLFGYLLESHSHDFPLVQAIKLITKYGSASIIKAYNHARQYENGPIRKQALSLASAHSCKGLEWDEVTIGSDMNDMIGTITTTVDESRNNDTPYELSNEDRSELLLYYVACSRAKKILNNATLLEPKCQQLSFNFN
jgi:hypothetical protein